MTATSSEATALAEIVQIMLVSSLFTLWFNSRRSNDPSGSAYPLLMHLDGWLGSGCSRAVVVVGNFELFARG